VFRNTKAGRPTPHRMEKGERGCRRGILRVAARFEFELSHEGVPSRMAMINDWLRRRAAWSLGKSDETPRNSPRYPQQSLKTRQYTR